MGVGGNPVPGDVFTRGYRSGGRGGAPAYGAGSQAGYDSDGSGASLARFQQRVQGKDSQGFLTDVAATQTAPGFDGWMAKWMTLQNRVVLDAIVNGHADQVQHIEDAFTRMGYQEMNRNLMNMDMALGRGDIKGAAAYGTLAYANFPDGAHVKFQTDGKGNLFAQRIGEANGQPLGDPIPVTQDAIRRQMRFTSNPQTYQKFLAEQQASSMKAQLDGAHADYFRNLNATRERMNQLTRQSEERRSIITGEYGLARARESGANKAETGLMTEPQKNTLLEKTDEAIVGGGQIGDMKLDTPEGQKAYRSSANILSSVLNRSNRQFSQPQLMALIHSIAKKEVEPAPTTTPGVVALVDKKSGQIVAALDEAIAVRSLGYDPSKYQQPAAATAPPTVQQPQAVPAGP
jgi:hypothetical protein